jgi:hypothetical protein
MRLSAHDHKEKVWEDKDGNVLDVDGFRLVPLPPAKNIENYHQSAKVFARELSGGKVTQEFWKLLKQRYQDETPYRHKWKDLKQKNKNIPEFSLRSDSCGRHFRFTYLESRFFYCSMYERRAKEEKDFKELKDKIRNGVNLEILGFDAYPVTSPLQTHYEDISRPFGHELVLYCLLTINESKDYPWNVYFEKHKELYASFV